VTVCPAVTVWGLSVLVSTRSAAFPIGETATQLETVPLQAAFAPTAWTA
jgi:hypothetical protein